MNIYEFIRYISEENVLFTINKIKLVNLVASEEIRSQVKTKFEMLSELSKSQQITFEFIIDYIGEDLISKIIQDINSQLKALDYDEQKILEDFLFDEEIRPRIFQILDSEMLRIMFAHSIQSEDIRDFLKQIYIIREIKDEEIKKQYKEKCKKFILDIADSKVLNEIVFIMNTYIDDVQAVFSLKELKDIIEKLLEKNIYDKSVEIGASISAGIINILNRIGCDEQYILEIFNKLMNKAKNVVDCKEENLGSYGRLFNLKMNIVFSIFNEEIRKKLLDRVLLDFPERYRLLIEATTNPKFIENKLDGRLIELAGIDPRILIGVEIEASLEKNKDVDFTLAAENRNIKGNKSSNEWIIKQDTTITYGNEYTSPILHDTPEEMGELCVICELLQELGYDNDGIKNTAGQINIGIDYLDTVRSLINFFEIYGNVEELLYHISNEKGHIMRQPICRYSKYKPVSGILKKITCDEDISREEFLKKLTKLLPKGMSVALRSGGHCSSCSDIPDRIECRIPNGSVKYKVWLDNIRLYGRIVQVAKELDIIQGLDKPTEEQIRKLKLKESLKSDLSLEEKLKILMDLLFDDEKTKQIYFDRYYTLQEKIRETGTDNYKTTDSEGTGKFGIVDFQSVYRNTIEMGESFEGVLRGLSPSCPERTDYLRMEDE